VGRLLVIMSMLALCLPASAQQTTPVEAGEQPPTAPQPDPGTEAQPAPVPVAEQLPPGYADKADLAMEELQHGNFEEARSRFLEAHAIYPNARSLRALGKVEYELKRYLAAIQYLEQALASDVRPLTAQLRQDTEEVLRKARGYVANYRIEARPSEASIWIDGVQVQPDPQGLLPLEVGKHKIEARAKGYIASQRSVTVAGGQDETLKLVLLPQKQPAQDGAIYGKWWLWAGVGAVVAGGVVAGLALSQRDPDITPATGGTTGAVLSIPDS